jgi:AcrR family transcriptional regulator
MVNRNSPVRAASQKLRVRLREQTSDAILEAAEQVFAADGVAKARMETIAQVAGVAVGTLYNHFDTRETLFSALVAARRTEIQAGLDEALAHGEGRPFGEQLELFLLFASDHLERHRDFLRILMEAEHMHGKTRFAMETVWKRAEVLVQRGVKAKALRAEDSELFPSLLMGLIRSCMMRRLYHGAPTIESIVKPVVRFFLDGAGAHR